MSVIRATQPVVQDESTSGYKRRATRIWPTLLSAAAQAAIRARSKKSARSAEVHTAVVMSRTAFDAYLHELFELRNIPPFVMFVRGPQGRKRLSQERWRLIGQQRRSLAGLPKDEKKEYDDVRELALTEKLQTLLQMVAAETDQVISAFESRFAAILLLNALRNAIVHHDFAAPSTGLLKTCAEIRRLAGAPEQGENAWEEMLLHASIAEWACRTTGRAIIEIETLDRHRKIHPVATRDAVVSAITPLKL